MTEVVEHNFGSATEAPTEARQFLRSTLQTWALDGFGEVTELLTGELVSNVVRHVGSPMTVRAIRDPSRVRVEVDDASSERPVVRDSPAMRGGSIENGGWGMRLVDALAHEWGTELRETGKTVWFEIDVTTATHEMHDESDS